MDYMSPTNDMFSLGLQSMANPKDAGMISLQQTLMGMNTTETPDTVMAGAPRPSSLPGAPPPPGSPGRTPPNPVGLPPKINPIAPVTPPSPKPPAPSVVPPGTSPQNAVPVTGEPPSVETYHKYWADDPERVKAVRNFEGMARIFRMNAIVGKGSPQETEFGIKALGMSEDQMDQFLQKTAIDMGTYTPAMENLVNNYSMQYLQALPDYLVQKSSGNTSGLSESFMKKMDSLQVALSTCNPVEQNGLLSLANAASANNPNRMNAATNWHTAREGALVAKTHAQIEKENADTNKADQLSRAGLNLSQIAVNGQEVNLKYAQFRSTMADIGLHQMTTESDVNYKRILTDNLRLNNAIIPERFRMEMADNETNRISGALSTEYANHQALVIAKQECLTTLADPVKNPLGPDGKIIPNKGDATGRDAVRKLQYYESAIPAASARVARFYDMYSKRIGLTSDPTPEQRFNYLVSSQTMGATDLRPTLPGQLAAKLGGYSSVALNKVAPQSPTIFRQGANIPDPSVPVALQFPSRPQNGSGVTDSMYEWSMGWMLAHSKGTGISPYTVPPPTAQEYHMSVDSVMTPYAQKMKSLHIPFPADGGYAHTLSIYRYMQQVWKDNIQTHGMQDSLLKRLPKQGRPVLPVVTP